MTSSDELAEVLRLSGDGLSIRAIAKRVGWSRMSVQRAVVAAAEAEAELDDDLDDLDLDRLSIPETRYVATQPFRFCGMEPVELDTPGCDPVEPVLMERFLDGNERSVTLADLYRADFQDGSVDRGYLDDALAQIEQAGYRRSGAIDGRWHWIGESTAAPGG